jgi:hypothetical protein
MKIRIHIQDGPKVYDFEHAGPTINLGRNPAGNIVLEEEATESVVSWEHARIDLSPREATLTDLRSTNGTYRNATPVSGTVPLWPKDVVRLGQTGPTLTVTVIDLTPATEPDPRLAPRPVGVAVAAAKVAKPQAAKAAAPVMSETRGIALQAVQNLMAQQEELKAQHAAQARHRRALMGVALVALLFFLLLGGGLLSYSGRLSLFGQRQDDTDRAVAETKQDVVALDAAVRKQGSEIANRLGTIETDQTTLRDVQNRTKEAVDKVLVEEAKIHGGLEKFKKDFGASLDDLNRKLTAKPDATPREAKPAANAAAGNKPSPRIEPGMKIDLVMRDGLNVYTGVLREITGTTVSIQGNPNPGAKPQEFDMKKVQAFQTREGIFAYNPASGEFESAITYFKLNKASGTFERTDDQREPYQMEDAQVLGAVTVRALWSPSERVIGLPNAAGQSPPPMDAYQLKAIWTVKGVYTYDQSKQDYNFASRADLAADAKEKRDQMFKDMDKKDWDRHVQSYELGTERLKALASAYRHWWWW